MLLRSSAELERQSLQRVFRSPAQSDMLTRMPRKLLLALLALLISIPLILAQPPERVDLNAIHKIKT